MTKPLKFLALDLEVTLTKSHGTKMVTHWMAGISGFGSLNQWKDLLSMDKHKLRRVFLRDSQKVSYESSEFFSRQPILIYITLLYYSV